jgi:hypothetical protein
VSVVRRQARRRWLAVACGVALLCGLPAIIAAWPVPNSSLSAAALRSRILSSGSVPYSGYAESSVSLGLPDLPDLGDVTTLLDGNTDQYSWYRSAGQWRSEVITTGGESDTYQTSEGTFLWDYSRSLLTTVIGLEPVRLPRAADLLPPDLARRLLSYSSPADHISRLPSQRIAGVDAAGLRVVPASPMTTIGAIEIWADPANGLPVEVSVTGRGGSQPVMTARFFDLNETLPSVADVTLDPAPGVAQTTTQLPDVRVLLNGFGPQLPSQLAGVRQAASPGGLADVAAYGSGFSRFAVVPLPHETGDHAVDGALGVGTPRLDFPGTISTEIQTPLVNAVLVQPLDRGPVYMLVGTVAAAELVKSASALLTDVRSQQP